MTCFNGGLPIAVDYIDFSAAEPCMLHTVAKVNESSRQRRLHCRKEEQCVLERSSLGGATETFSWKI